MELVFKLIFSGAMVVNAFLFIPQCLRIVRHNTGETLSLTTFGGFFVIQLITVVHGILHEDLLLTMGAGLSMMCCGSCLALIVYFRARPNITQLLAEMNQEIMGDPIDPDAQSSLSYAKNIRSFYRNMIDIMPGYVYWRNKDGIFMGCNKNMLDYLGLKDESEYIGKTYHHFFNDAQCRQLQEVDNKVMSTNTAMSLEEATVPNEVYYTQKIPLHNQDGAVCGLLGVSIDITKRKEAEIALNLAKTQAERLNKMKMDFIKNMRHDIKTPLTNLVGLTHIIDEIEDKNPKTSALAKDLLCSGDTLLQLINEMFEYTDISEGKVPIKNQFFDVAQLTESVCQTLLSDPTTTNVTLEKSIQDDIPILVGDAPRLRRVLLNLLHNAIKFTPNGLVEIDIATQYIVDNKLMLVLQVKDDGIGVSAHDQELVFNDFTKLAPSYKKNKYQGSGLGLSIVRQFINDLEGKLTFESTVNTGTIVTCCIPFTINQIDVKQESTCHVS